MATTPLPWQAGDLVTISTTADTLNLAHQRVCGSSLAPRGARMLADQGWTPDLFDVVGAAAEHAVAHDTAAVLAARSQRAGGTPASLVARSLITAAATWRQDEEHPVLVRGWLPVLAAVPTPRMYNTLSGVYMPNPGPRVAYWRAAGALGPLAWAAGLSLEETTSQEAAGALQEDTLRAMAALRGIRLPA